MHNQNNINQNDIKKCEDFLGRGCAPGRPGPTLHPSWRIIYSRFNPLQWKFLATPLGMFITPRAHVIIVTRAAFIYYFCCWSCDRLVDLTVVVSALSLTLYCVALGSSVQLSAEACNVTTWIAVFVVRDVRMQFSAFFSARSVIRLALCAFNLILKRRLEECKLVKPSNNAWRWATRCRWVSSWSFGRKQWVYSVTTL